MSSRPIVVLCGGVGAARFLRALTMVVAPTEVTAIVNTGDDTTMHGLRICPDLDTVTYTLAQAIDHERGWGLINETWHAMESLRRYESQRPDGSNAGGTWFGLGDRDLATHLYRTARIDEGATLTEVTREIAKSWNVEVELLPMTESPAPTTVLVDPAIDAGPAGDGRIAFQDYFVRHHHSIPVRSVDLAARHATPTQEVQRALSQAQVIVVAPSNPFVSIGPIRALQGIDDLLSAAHDRTVAISPIIGGEALKGPAADMMRSFGVRADALGIAEHYQRIARHIVIDDIDRHLSEHIAALGLSVSVTNTLMADPNVAARLASATLNAAGYQLD